MLDRKMKRPLGPPHSEVKTLPLRGETPLASGSPQDNPSAHCVGTSLYTREALRGREPHPAPACKTPDFVGKNGGKISGEGSGMGTEFALFCRILSHGVDNLFQKRMLLP